MIFSKIIDGTGKKFTAKITPTNALLITEGSGGPSYGEKQKIIPLIQYLTLNGLSNGTKSMLVNGSLSTPIDFFIPAHNENDIYISHASFVISDANAALNKFGALTALTNGCQFFYTTKFTGNQYFGDALTTNFDLVRMAQGFPTVSLLQNAIGASEAFIPIIDFAQLIPPYGIKLDYGTDQKLIFRIRDDITSLDVLNCIIYGFMRLPD